MHRVLVAALVVVATARVAHAHQTSVKYVDLRVDGDHVDATLRVSPGDVTEPLGLPADAKPSVTEAVAAPAVAAYIARWFAIAGCHPGAPHAHADDDGKFVVVEWRSTCASTAQLTLDFTAFFALDQRHIAIIRFEAADGSTVDAIVRAGDPPLVLGARSLTAWVRAGVDHIYGGPDHISFVLALLLVVMLVRSPPGAAPRWQTRALWPTLVSTAKVITAFTIAHSVSLIVASLGWVSLPSRLVESAIALSIAYTAIENIVYPDVRWRFWLTFGFGLAHGLGFASTLSTLLPPHDVLAPLLLFNVGVELGQLSIVLIALPVLTAIARGIGADRYRHRVMPALSAVIAVLGVNWLVGRALGVVILPWAFGS